MDKLNINNKEQGSINYELIQKIGKELRNLRIKKNISLDEIAAQILIPKKILIAIETANLKELPEPFYIKALIKKYSRELGLDIAEKYPYFLLENKSDRSLSQVPIVHRESLLKKKSNIFQLQSGHLYLIYILLMGITVRTITSTVENPIIAEDKITTPEVESLLTESSSSSQLISQSYPSLSDSVTVDIDLKDHCWLKVMVDGKLEYEGTLPKGTHRTWTGNQTVTIVAGNAGGIEVAYNKGKGILLGKPGQVQEITYSVN